jgi:predicted DNA-binding protein (UPF0251 family)
VSIAHVEISEQEFAKAMTKSREKLTAMFKESKSLEKEILVSFERIFYE